MKKIAKVYKVDLSEYEPGWGVSQDGNLLFKNENDANDYYSKFRQNSSYYYCSKPKEIYVVDALLEKFNETGRLRIERNKNLTYFMEVTK